MSENRNGEEGPQPPLPSQTLEAVAKSFYKQAQEYGFTREDYVRFVNILLDLGLDRTGVYTPPPTSPTSTPPTSEGTSGQITVRLASEEDLPQLQAWMDDPVGSYFLATRIDSGDCGELEELFRSPRSEFGIAALDEKPIGAFAFLNIDQQHHKAELRKLIGDPAARGMGYAKRATQYWIEYGVAHLGLRKLYVNTLDTNLANIRLNESLGFRVEGLLREELLLPDGLYHDILRMSLILPG